MNTITEFLKSADIDPHEFDREATEMFEAILRDAAERLEVQMQAVRSAHVDAAMALKGRIVPKTNSKGNPVLGTDGKPRNQRLVFWFEVRVERRKTAPGGLSFPRIYWYKRRGGQQTIARGPQRGKKVCPGDRVVVDDATIQYPMSAFSAANVIERDLIAKTESRAAYLRAQAKFYADIWQRIRHYRQSSPYVARYDEKVKA